MAGVLPVEGGEPEVIRIENAERSLRRLVAELGGPEGLAVCCETGPCRYDLYRLLAGTGVACQPFERPDRRRPGSPLMRVDAQRGRA